MGNWTIALQGSLNTSSHNPRCSAAALVTLALLLASAWPVPALEQAPVRYENPTGKLEIVRVTLADAAVFEKAPVPLHLRLYVRDGKLTGGQGWCDRGPRTFVVEGECRRDGNRWTATLWQLDHGDNANVRWAAEYSIIADCAGAKLAGTYSAVTDKKKVSGAVTGQIQTAAEAGRDNTLAPGVAWPMWRGPNGNGTAAQGQSPLVPSWSRARRVWLSEARTPTVRTDHSPPCPESTYTSPIVAEGLVFLHSSVPRTQGPFLDKAGNFDLLLQKAGKDDRAAQIVRARYALFHDDVVWAMDAATGATVWQTRFECTGLNSMDGHTTLFSTPVYAGGRVYVGGLSRRVYCLEAQTGKVLWQTSVYPEFTAAFETARKQTTQDANPKNVPSPDRYRLESQNHGSPVIAGGVLVWMNKDRAAFWDPNRDAKQPNRLIGLNPATGAEVWVSEPNACGSPVSPTKWVHAGNEYLLTDVGLFDPVTGKRLWKFPAPCGVGNSVTVSDDLMISVAAGKATIYRLTLEKPQVLWQHTWVKRDIREQPVRNGRMDVMCAWLGGKGWFFWPCRKGPAVLVAGADKDWTWREFDDYSGSGIGSCLAIGDLVLPVGESGAGSPFRKIWPSQKEIRYGHEPLEGKELLGKKDPSRLAERLGEYWSLAQCPAYADGRFYFRSHEGVLCYDLRQAD